MNGLYNVKSVTVCTVYKQKFRGRDIGAPVHALKAHNRVDLGIV
jgi:hypothetical protein